MIEYMEKERKYKIYKWIMIIALTIFITFMITSISLYTYFLNNPINANVSATSTSKKIAGNLEKYREIIDKYYLGEVDENKLEEGAIKGYIEGLGDPYTEYISKEDMEDYLNDTMGNFVGIGIYMVKNTTYDKIQVLSTIKDGPAEKAGIQAGDLIVSVDGITYTASDMTTAANNIKGEAGTKVNVEIQRENQIIKYELTREKVKVNPVEGKVLENNIGYIQFSSFDETTAEDFKNKFEELNKKGIKSLIIDLRNNGGGIVDQALEIADYITDKDSVLLYEVDKTNKETVKKAQNDPIINMPIVILTNENTASASEILAGALKDLGKAKTVGTTTYGKGVIQQILRLSDGSGLKITIEEYQTPNRNKINKVGIEPDEKVELPDTVTNIFNVKENEDTQLQKAIGMLK
ncbi:carboxyl-terminal protease [Clostridium sp. CAG:575]|nr:carboxyl-terminal protease [Clostridium sp. CAG:575]